MTMQVNKDGADWLLVKRRLNEIVSNCQENMLTLMPPEEYHRYRGMIIMAKELIEWVEPTIPPKTTEESYGMLDPNRENYT